VEIAGLSLHRTSLREESEQGSPSLTGWGGTAGVGSVTPQSCVDLESPVNVTGVDVIIYLRTAIGHRIYIDSFSESIVHLSGSDDCLIA
jgi:hypothetical protein